MCTMENTKMYKYPFEISEVDEKTTVEVKKYFKGLWRHEFVYIGPNKYFYPDDGDIHKRMNAIYNMPIRPDDIFISTFPRSGTTLTQELVWLVANDLDFATARKKHLIQRYAVVGSYFINPKEEMQKLNDYKQRDCKNIDILLRMMTPPTELLAKSPSPRFIKCHIPLSLLPPNVLDVAKTIYVARDPRDVAVSLYYLYRQLKLFEFKGSFKTFWNFFMKGYVVRGPLIEQVIEAWKQRHHPNMLFIFYEDIIHDTTNVVRKICRFLNKNYSNEQIDCLCEHLKFENFKNNPSVNLNFLEEFNAIVPGEQSFVRKGKSGGWPDYFDEEMTEQAQRWIDDHLSNTDLRFPKYQ